MGTILGTRAWRAATRSALLAVVALAALPVGGARAEQTATISGTVTDLRLSGYYGTVSFFSVTGDQVATAPVATISVGGGDYTETLPAGHYVVGFSLETTDEYATQYYDGVQGGAASPADATVLDAEEGANLTGIDATLTFDPTKGEVHGTVTDTAGGLYTGDVGLYRDEGGTLTLTVSTFCYQGQFSRYLDPGDYRLVYAADPDDAYPTTYFSSAGATTSATSATDLTVTAGGSVDASAELTPDAGQGSIAGHVTIPDGSGLFSGTATFTWVGDDASAHPVLTAYVGNGDYSRPLRPGPYLVGFSLGDDDGYADQYYDHKSSADGATVVTVGVGARVTGIDGALAIDQGDGHISGTVSADGAPYDGTAAFYRQDDDSDATADFTASVVAGSYSRALPPGHYKVGFNPGGTGGFTTSYYPDATSLASADEVEVVADQTLQGIDGTIATVATAPDAPVGVSAVGGDAEATVTWAAPGDDHGAAIAHYTVIASPGGATRTVDASHTSTTIVGLTDGTAYTFTVTATSSAGTSVPSAPSDPVVPAGPPGAPTGVTAVAGHGAAAVSWKAPDDHGAAITRYTVTASPGGMARVVDPARTTVTMTRLTRGVRYTFTVVAANSAGESPASARSNPVTPTAIPVALTTVTGYKLTGLPTKAKHTKRYRVRVTLKAGATVVSGTLKVYDSTHVIGTARVVKGVAKVTLHKLKKGKRKIHVVYSGSSRVKPFVGPVKKVRVR